MINSFIKFILVSHLLVCASALAAGKKASERLDTLGGNEKLVEMAASMDPNNRARIVQKRIVDRNNALELGINYGAVAGGDSYLKTQNLGASMDFHLNPRWSIGARYYDYGNSLTPEGQRVFDQARQSYEAGGRSYSIPDIDYPLRSALAVISWYPIYGKTNLLDWGIAQFDIYLLAGAGQIELSSGWTSLATAGTGVGLWLSKHISARAEIRYQNYQDKIITGPRNMQTYTGSIGLGIIL